MDIDKNVKKQLFEMMNDIIDTVIEDGVNEGNMSCKITKHIKYINDSAVHDCFTVAKKTDGNEKEQEEFYNFLDEFCTRLQEWSSEEE